MAASAPREDLLIPDRYERLRDKGDGTLRSIIVPVEDALDVIAAQVASDRCDLESGRGGPWGTTPP